MANLIGKKVVLIPKKEASLGPSLKEGSRVFYIKDNGIGIRDKHLDRIFTIFKRLHGRDKYGGGTGAGLTIVRKIIEQYGGNIWVESQIGKGTTFYFTLSENGVDDSVEDRE